MMKFGLAAVILMNGMAAQAPAQEQGSFQITGGEACEHTDQAEIAVRAFSDDANGESLPVCVVVTDRMGNHPDGSAHGVYADGRFFADGQFIVTVPPGPTKVSLRSGPNHVPLEFAIDAKAGTRTNVDAELHRWFAPEERGWYSGDNHVHAQHDPTAVVKSGLNYTALQGRAMGLSFITESGSHVDYDLVDELDTDTFLFRFARELRPGCYTGHFNTPGINASIPEKFCTSFKKGPVASQTVIAAAHDLGGIVTYTHPLTPPHQLHWMGAMSLFSDAVLGRCADLMDLDSRQTELLWFTALNLGNRIGCSSYTDCGLGRVNSGSPGARRLYCHAEEFTYPSIVDAMRQGHTFATNGGPIYPFLSIDGHEPGDVIALESGSDFEARVEVQSLFPLKTAQLFRNGNVAHEFEVVGHSGETHLSHRFSERDRSWYVFRVQNEKGHWAITSPIYFEPAQAEPKEPASAVMLEISNCARFIELRHEFFAHLIITVNPEDRLVAVELLKDGQTTKSFTPEAGNDTHSGKTPVTELSGDYAPGWLWHPKADGAFHFQADWPVTETGWYAIRVLTEAGRTLESDAVHFDSANPNSQELSVAHLAGGAAQFTLWGYGEEMPLADIKQPFEGDHWYYPKNTFWRITAVSEGQEHALQGGKDVEGERHFRKRSD